MTEVLLNGSEFVLVAQVPKAGNRWHQVHFNAELVSQFFRLEGSGTLVTLQRIDESGKAHEPFVSPLVLSPINGNSKIEFHFGDERDYPPEGRPILLLLEVELHNYRYQLLMPGSPGHAEMSVLNESLTSIGRGLRRGISTLDEIELRWPACRLARPFGLAQGR